MSVQSYKQHAKYYTPHHFIFYPVVLFLLCIAIQGAWQDDSAHRKIWMLIGALVLLIGWLSFMMRQHYALGTQNRMVRMEMRFRYYVLTGQRLEPLEQRLSFRQLAALRFAPDDELPGLLQRALEENLSPADIKKSIKNWLPDNMRV
ncbi:MAG TPA: DUF6526 family protein [Chitinophagaceae bacterium]|jgi:hypothetical protein